MVGGDEKYDHKAFVRPNNVEIAYMHGVVDCYYSCKPYYMPTNLSHLSHFRDSLRPEDDTVTIEDKTIWKYKEELIEAVEKRLKVTGFRP